MRALIISVDLGAPDYLAHAQEFAMLAKGAGAQVVDELPVAADDITVSVVSSAIVLTLDPAGVKITDLHTSYSASANSLTITAATKSGTISTAGAIPGVTVNSAADTITVNLGTVKGFAG